MSHTIKGENIVNAEKKIVITPIPVKKQKDFKAGSYVVQPKRKARAFVKLVIVIDCPAFTIACLNFSSRSFSLDDV